MWSSDASAFGGFIEFDWFLRSGSWIDQWRLLLREEEAVHRFTIASRQVRFRHPRRLRLSSSSFLALARLLEPRHSTEEKVTVPDPSLRVGQSPTRCTTEEVTEAVLLSFFRPPTRWLKKRLIVFQSPEKEIAFQWRFGLGLWGNLIHLEICVELTFDLYEAVILDCLGF